MRMVIQHVAIPLTHTHRELDYDPRASQPYFGLHPGLGPADANSDDLSRNTGGLANARTQSAAIAVASDWQWRSVACEHLVASIKPSSGPDV